MPAMINCPYCGKLTDPKLENCPHCGGFVQRATPPPRSGKSKRANTQTCPNCHAVVKDGDIICVACGTNLLTGHKIAEETRQTTTTRNRSAALKWAGIALIAVLVTVALVGLIVFLVNRDPVQKAVDMTHNNQLLPAIDLLKKHLERKPEDVRAQDVLAKLYWQTNQFPYAATAFETMLANTGDVNAGLNAVACLAAITSEDTLDRRIDILQKVTVKDPGNAKAWRLLGMALGKKGEAQLQADALKKAAELDPADPAIHLNLGLALALAGNFDEAQKELTQAQQGSLEPGNTLAALGMLASLQGNAEEAIARLTAVLSSQTDATLQKEVLTRLGLVLTSQRRFTEAAPYLKRVVDQDPEAAIPRFFLALCEMVNGADADAIQDFERLSQKSGPFAAEAALFAAHLHIQQKDYDRARQSIERAATYGAQGAPIETLRGRILAQSGQFSPARTAFQKAVETNPEFPAAHLELALTLIKQEQFAESTAELDKYLSLVDRSNEDARAGEIEALAQQLRETLASSNPTQTQPAPAPQIIAAPNAEGRASS